MPRNRLKSNDEPSQRNAAEKKSRFGKGILTRFFKRLTIHPFRPFDTLPNEILEEVFHQYIGPAPASLQQPDGGNIQRVTVYLSHRCTPIQLGHICSRWRAVSHSTPTLWSRVAVNCPQSPSDVELFKFYLSRSRAQGTPLDIRLYQEYSTAAFPLKQPKQEVVRAIICAVFAEPQRLRSWTLDSGFHVLYRLPHWRKLSFPILEAFQVDYDPLKPEQYREFIQKLCTCPNLQDFDIVTACLVPTWIPTIPWNRLKVIRIHDSINSAELLKVLSACSSTLQACHIFGNILEGSQEPDQAVILPPTWGIIVTIPHLKILTFQVTNAPHTLTFLRLPSLQDLTICSRAFNRRDHILAPDIGQTWRILIGLIERSHCHLEALRFEARWRDPSDMTQYALNSPVFNGLRLLSIEAAGVSESAIKFLSPTLEVSQHANEFPLPRLNTLGLNPFTSNAKLGAMVSLRRQRTPGLRLVRLIPSSRFGRTARQIEI